MEYKQIKEGWSQDDLAQLVNSSTYLRHSSSPAFLAYVSALFLKANQDHESLFYASLALNIDPTALDAYFDLSILALKHNLDVSANIKSFSNQILKLSEKLNIFSYIFSHMTTKPTVAVVGNSPSEMGRTNGQVIDSNDIVIRFNNFPIHPRYKRGYGSKCTIWVRTPSIEEVPYRKDIHPKTIVFTGTLLRHIRNGNWKSMLALCDKDINLAIFDNMTFRKLTNMLNAPPSAGILTIYSLHHLDHFFSQVSHFGFSFNNNGQNHLYDKCKASKRHNWTAEKKIFSELVILSKQKSK